MSEIKITYTPTKVAPVKIYYRDEEKLKLSEIAEKLKSKLGADAVVASQDVPTGDAFLLLSADKIWESLKFLRDEPSYEFSFMQVISATDFMPKEGEEESKEGRIELLYVLHSFCRQQQINLKVYLDRSQPALRSVADLFRCANWYERECYDLLGVHFEGHPDLERILLPDDWVGHPLRKDYEYPEEYNGMKVPL